MDDKTDLNGSKARMLIGSVDRPDLQDLIRKSIESVNLMSPLDRAIMRLEQRRSFVRGNVSIDPSRSVDGIDKGINSSDDFLILDAYYRERSLSEIQRHTIDDLNETIEQNKQVIRDLVSIICDYEKTLGVNQHALRHAPEPNVPFLRWNYDLSTMPDKTGSRKHIMVKFFFSLWAKDNGSKPLTAIVCWNGYSWLAVGAPTDSSAILPNGTVIVAWCDIPPDEVVMSPSEGI